MSPAFSLLVAFVLLAANGFFVAAEFALVKSRGVRIDIMAEENRFGAKLAQTMHRNIEAYLACCQLGITMASLGLGWVGEPTVSAIVTPLLHPLGLSDEVIHLTDREREMLRILAVAPGETVPRGALTGNGSVNERAVDVQINRLRRKIERDPASPLFLQAVRGIGYRLVASP